MITTFLIVFLENSTTVEFSHIEFSVYALSKYDKFDRLLGWVADIDDAKSLILSSFSNVSKIIPISSNIKFNKKLL